MTVTLNDKTSVTVSTVAINYNNKTISLHSTDNLIATIPIHEAEMIADAVQDYYCRHYYCRLDVKNYFSDKGYDPAILDNKLLIDAITTTYVDFRDNADGGEYEDSMHWTKCLDKAIEIYSNQVGKYVTKENDT